MTASPGSVQAVTRALNILTILGNAESGMRVSDIAEHAGLALSTTHRLLSTMASCGFVHFESAQRKWHVGREAFAVGAAFLQRRNFVAPALNYLRRLRDETKETANLGVLDNGQLVTLSQIESREITRAIAPPGGRVSATCSAMGKAIMSSWHDDQISSHCERYGFSALTSKSHAKLSSFMLEMEQIRRMGFAIDDEEHAKGLRCVAAAVYSAEGEAVGAISVSGIASRMRPEKVGKVARQVVAAAKGLSEDIGGTPSSLL